MMHKNRRFAVSEVESIDDLVEKLANHSWCGCQGFRLKDTYWLNDSTSGDGAQEFAVFIKITEDINLYAEIESITVSWCSPERLRELIEKMLDTSHEKTIYGNYTLIIQTPQEHKSCYCCM